MFLFSHNVANWTPFFLLKLLIDWFIYLFNLHLHFCLSPKYVEKKKKKMQPTPRIWVFLSVVVRFGLARFGSVRFGSVLIWFDLIWFRKWPIFLQMDIRFGSYDENDIIFTTSDFQPPGHICPSIEDPQHGTWLDPTQLNPRLNSTQLNSTRLNLTRLGIILFCNNFSKNNYSVYIYMSVIFSNFFEKKIPY
jgi:hypothetical protein